MYSYARDACPMPKPEEVVILNFAVALKDSSDWNNQQVHPNENPMPPGQGAAGIILYIGENVTGFREGQRVLAQCPNRNQPGAPSHQFTVVSEKMVSAIPDRLSFEQAATLPLAVALAAAGLYQKNHLGISLPYTPPSPTSRTILVLDGASDVGAMVVQLASASGMDVIATASKRNFNIVRSFGASIVMDHDSLAQGVLATALDDLPLAGIFDTISTPQSLASIDTLLAIMEQSPRVCTLKPPAQRPSHFAPSIVVSTTINRNPHTFVRTAIWEEFLPLALKSRLLRPKPMQTVIKAHWNDLGTALAAVKALPRKSSDGTVVISFV
ncbi:hypothetical protein WHR41_03336 [Cladosporium halotolerans]|uniref:Enoyl reductase (ER) domain-containing protein n=1 Tax=Cladosporium halotolerans TaxID=1052096 RepID=A0AB34KWG6_9PEZI